MSCNNTVTKKEQPIKFVVFFHKVIIACHGSMTLYSVNEQQMHLISGVILVQFHSQAQNKFWLHGYVLTNHSLLRIMRDFTILKKTFSRRVISTLYLFQASMRKGIAVLKHFNIKLFLFCNIGISF